MYPDKRVERLKKWCYKKKAKRTWVNDRAIFKKPWSKMPNNEEVKFGSEKIIEPLDKPMADAIFQVRSLVEIFDTKKRDLKIN